MKSPFAFIRTHLDPVDRMDEVLFGLIMAIGFTGACRLGLEEADNRTLFVQILGCNVAWAIVDGSMYVLSRLHDRGRRTRLFRTVVEAPTEEEAVRRIARELDDRIEPLTTDDERRKFYRAVLALLKRGSHERGHLQWDDVLAGVAVALAIVFATIPVIVPFLLFDDVDVAVRVANGVAVVMLFWIGTWWGRAVGASPWGVGLGLTAFAIVMVAVTLLLGG